MLELGKLLIITGALLLIVGIAIQYGPSIPFLGKLPGDIRIQRDNFTFYFPLTTSILISIVVSIIFTLFRK